MAFCVESIAACKDWRSVPGTPGADAPGLDRGAPACAAANSITTRDLIWLIKENTVFLRVSANLFCGYCSMTSRSSSRAAKAVVAFGGVGGAVWVELGVGVAEGAVCGDDRVRAREGGRGGAGGGGVDITPAPGC